MLFSRFTNRRSDNKGGIKSFSFNQVNIKNKQSEDIEKKKFVLYDLLSLISFIIGIVSITFSISYIPIVIFQYRNDVKLIYSIIPLIYVLALSLPNTILSILCVYKTEKNKRTQSVLGALFSFISILMLIIIYIFYFFSIAIRDVRAISLTFF